MKVNSIVLVSKVVAGLVCSSVKMETSMAAQLKKNAALVPSTTRTSIVGDLCRRDRYALT